MTDRDAFDFSRLSVLLVDDESFVRTMMKQILRALGCTNVREAPDGASALKELELYQPSLVVCDLNMEPVDGLVFVQMVRNHQLRAVRELPIIILSGQNDLGSVKQAAARGINAYLIKPVSMQALKSRIESVMTAPRLVQVGSPTTKR
ncbi:response regulator [Caenispirillum bisanense]|uniref:Two-component system, chemotaxis family, response regulator CheY n=1 Tax=Caenispirillum bisanense TaxID=414052 RepID=A0A286G924_9PROT|nr:response regulator [Caenispirillum bisanense]SOD91995.1 two-component system, chemotaxis family, response regulator CheY [Caenispirillum bisanense]